MKSLRILLAATLVLSVAGAGTAGPPPPLSGASVTLYEVNERVTFDPEQGVTFRNATAPLLGFAELGSPLCPSQLLVAFPQMARCTVSATGTSHVSTVTGWGPVSGTFDVVINAPGNSSVHVPDLPVLSGTFAGQVDLSLAVVHHVPLGFINGTFTIPQLDQNGASVLVELPFSGTFRLPFGIDDLGRPSKSDHLHAAFYLADNFRTRIPVRPDERSVGFPPVRLEVRFGP